MAKLDLQPRKVFVIAMDDGTTYEGKFGTWALKRTSDRSGIKLSEIAEAYQDSNKALDLSISLLLSAIEHTARQQGKPFSLTDVHACEIIDELGGVGGDEFVRLMNHSGDESEKKSNLNGDLSGLSLSVSSVQPAEA